jgi:hypothetical protein
MYFRIASQRVTITSVLLQNEKNHRLTLKLFAIYQPKSLLSTFTLFCNQTRTLKIKLRPSLFSSQLLRYQSTDKEKSSTSASSNVSAETPKSTPKALPRAKQNFVN